MRALCVIQAREGSRRLPGKSLLPLVGKPLIVHVVERARAIRGVDVKVAIPTGDELLAHVLWVAGVDVYEGAADDVLARFLGASEGAQIIMRVTGDCPLLDPDVCLETLNRFSEEGADYATNDTLTTGWPDGTDVEVFSREFLNAADVSTTGDAREHVTGHQRRLAGMRIVTVPSEHDYSALKLSVDTQEDFDRVAAVLAQRPAHFGISATIDAARKAGVWR
jgi:spore coat polysaccharide biosynthesis protein SpsF (cytidylyltransferase family)